MAGTPKRIPDHTQDLPLVSVGENIDSTTKIQTPNTTTLMDENEFNGIPASEVPLE